MPNLYPYQQFVRIGVQSDRTTVNTFGSIGPSAGTEFELAISQGGLQGVGTLLKEPIPTRHKVRGDKYIVQRTRNADAGLSLQSPLFPQHAKFMLDSVIANSSGENYYHTIDNWYNNTAITGSGRGSQLAGCLFNGFQLSVDRSTSTSIIPTWTGFINADTELTGTVPSYTGPVLTPYDSLHAFIDLQEYSGGSVTWAGDNPDIRSIDINFSPGIGVTDFRPSTTAEYNRSWTRQTVGQASLTVTANLIVTDSAYLDYLRNSEPNDFALRVMFWHTESSFSDTAMNETLTAGMSNTITLDNSESGLANNDIVLITNAAQDKVNVCTASGVTTGAFNVDDTGNDQIDIAVTTQDLTIRNCAFMIKIPRLDVAVGPTQDDGDLVVVPLTLTAQLEAGETDLLSTRAYNDNNS